MMDIDTVSQLEDICFKYERLDSLLSCLQTVVAEIVDVGGMPKNSLNYGLYEIESEMYKNNNELKRIIESTKVIKGAQA